MTFEHGITRQFLAIEPAAIDSEELLICQGEREFVGRGLDLVIEAGSYVCVACNIYPSGQTGWTRDEAIIGGLLVRVYKLIHVILDQTTKHRTEPLLIFGRLHFEAVVDALFLMQKNGDCILFRDFVIYSLQHELNQIEQIETNIVKRNGEKLPIEERMITSINRAFRKAGIRREDMPSKRIRSWSKSDLKARAYAVGLGEAYLPIFANGSQFVHGNWSDLYAHHLFEENGRFTAKIDFKQPRPQILEAISLVSSVLVERYFDHLGLYRERPKIMERLENFRERVIVFSDLHEKYLSK